MTTPQEWRELGREFGRIGFPQIFTLLAFSHNPRVVAARRSFLDEPSETHEWWTISGGNPVSQQAFKLLAAVAGKALGAPAEYVSQCWLDFVCDDTITPIRSEGARRYIDEDIRIVSQRACELSMIRSRGRFNYAA